MMNKWYMRPGKEDDVCLSSRIRLARNLKNYPFPSKMTLQQRQEVCRAVWEAVQKGGFDGPLKLRYVKMDKISDTEAYSMVERHIISPNFAKYRAGRGLILSSDESVSIMLGEEDHIRIQVIAPGLDLHEAYDLADKLDTLLCESLEIAFDRRLGFLTECPTNLGTGLRASVMLHLPALSATGAIGRLCKAGTDGARPLWRGEREQGFSLSAFQSGYAGSVGGDGHLQPEIHRRTAHDSGKGGARPVESHIHGG